MGSVAKPGDYSSPREDATLSRLLGQAGGIAATGSDLVTVTYLVGDKIYSLQIRGIEFYSQDRDYMLPAGAKIYVAECVAVGLGNLTGEEFARLGRLRAEYEKRRQAGQIETRELGQK